MTAVPFLRPTLPSLEQIGLYYRMAEEARFFTNGGPCERLLRARLGEYLGGVGCVPVNNATNGIMIAVRAVLDAAGTGRRPLVVMPSYTFVATAGAVRMLGYEPLFVDVDPSAWQMDPDVLDDVLARRHGQVAAVLGTNTFGLPPSAAVSRRWARTCERYGVPLVIDAAAGFGAEDDTGARTGRSSVLHVFSFHATKPFAIGEGGVVTTTDPELLERVEALHSFGFVNGRIAMHAGVNTKMDELHAASALAVLDGYDEVLRRRRETVAFYQESLSPYGFSFQLGSSGGTWQAGYVAAPDAATREVVLVAAASASVGVAAYYDRPVHRHPAYADAPVHGSLAVTEDLATRALALPMSNDLTEGERQRVVDVVIGAAVQVDPTRGLTPPGGRPAGDRAGEVVG